MSLDIRFLELEDEVVGRVSSSLGVSDQEVSQRVSTVSQSVLTGDRT